MGIAKSLTTDLQRAVKLYRVPMLTALGLSLRNAQEDRFLVTDPRTEDKRRNLLKLERVVAVERQMTKLDVGVDSRQFVDMGGLLLFDGVYDAAGQAVPGPNVSISGGRQDSDDVMFTATGTAEEKSAKLKRYVLRRPEQVQWRVRTPILMASETAVLDYLAFRATKLQFLHSIAFKWSDRRWDARAVPLSVDMFRPEGERTQQVVLAPVWMSEDMSILDPNIWGAYQTLLRANYDEYLGRRDDEYRNDLLAFVDMFQDYTVVLQPGQVCSSQAESNWQQVGRLERKLTTTHNRVLHIPFDRSLDTRNDSYHPRVSDPTGALDATADLFNLEDADGHWRLTSSFEASSLAVDGWFGAANTLAQVADVPAGLPAYAKNRAGADVFGTKSLRVVDGFAARRLILPDGRFVLRLWVKNVAGDGRVEVVRNTRLKPKQITVNIPTSRVSSISHFREAYETVQTATLRGAGWRQVDVSFELKDHFFVKNEGYPAHEVFVVLSTVDGSATPPEVRFDHLQLLVDQQGHDVTVQNTATRTPFPDLLLASEKVVDLGKAFADDSVYLSHERAGSFFRFDGANTCCIAKHRNGYNLHPSGTNINAWWKVNGADENLHQVLQRRGSFTLFKKGGEHLPSYEVTVNQNRELSLGWAGAAGAASTGFRNHLIHPSLTDGAVPAVTNWGAPATQYARYTAALKGGGKQPREWTTAGNTTQVSLSAALSGVDVGNGKTLVISAGDPYRTTGRAEMADPADGSHVTVWMYFEWHARNAYRLTLPEAQVLKYDAFADFSAHTATGNVFLPVPVNTELLAIPESLGSYSPSPAAWSPHFGGMGSPLLWPISPCEWGGSPNLTQWPAQYGTPPHWNPFSLSDVADVDTMLSVSPMFVEGALTFDRWFNLDMNADGSGVEIRVNGVLLANGAGGTFNVVDGKENSDDLLIATSNPNDTNTCAPVSCWSFKIAQAKYAAADIKNIVEAEAINLNELQYNIWGQYLDFDGDKQFDWYQESLTDFGLEMKWANAPVSPAVGPFPSTISTLYGKVVVSAADPITVVPQADRNRDAIEDHLDEGYLRELIDAQALGYSDGLVFWDFVTDQNDAFHSFTHKVYDPNCKAYRNVTLDYRSWVHDLVNTEFNSVKAVTDPIPTLGALSSSPSPGPTSPQGTYGDGDDELLMNGVKGWFGFEDLLGYRDSLEQLQNEGMIFNYLQVEFRFRADRSTLESHLKQFAQSYDQLFLDDFPGNRLKKLG